MKKYYFEEEDMTMVVGTAREIKSLYATMEKKGFYPVFSDQPKFNMDRMYGITYTGCADTFEDGFSVVNADTIVRILTEEE